MNLDGDSVVAVEFVEEAIRTAVAMHRQDTDAVAVQYDNDKDPGFTFLSRQELRAVHEELLMDSDIFQEIHHKCIFSCRIDFCRVSAQQHAVVCEIIVCVKSCLFFREEKRRVVVKYIGDKVLQFV